MAKTVSWGYSNEDPSTSNQVTGIKLNLKTNYALVADEPDVSRLSNKTSPLDQPELVTYRGKAINRVDTAITVRNPGPVPNGVQYSIKVEDVLRTSDPSIGLVVDEPIAAVLTIKHTASSSWSNSNVAYIIKRLLGACYDETTSDWRFEDLMRSALTPTEN